MAHGVENLISILYMNCEIKQNMYWLVVVKWGTTNARLNEMVGFRTPPRIKCLIKFYYSFYFSFFIYVVVDYYQLIIIC